MRDLQRRGSVPFNQESLSTNSPPRTLPGDRRKNVMARPRGYQLLRDTSLQRKTGLLHEGRQHLPPAPSVSVSGSVSSRGRHGVRLANRPISHSRC